MKYHVNAIVKCITCTEKNQPESDKEKMKPSIRQGQLYEILTYQQTKSFDIHLVHFE